MSGERKINKTHPQYPEYIAKCKRLWNKYEKLINEEENRRKAECPDWKSGLDVLETVEKRKLYTCMNRELRMLQEEYAYLFTEQSAEQ